MNQEELTAAAVQIAAGMKANPELGHAEPRTIARASVKLAQAIEEEAGKPDSLAQNVRLALHRGGRER
ncbi:MAG: hypothetical protein P4L85_14245 [Paludisphaera borealis]|uniref:hypothetical protein n=1 Tax=Paludisphaera borealis TaxID=1387353 RepID=UPI00284BD7B4|nr:hypothetical protein [Paludisphaera borealis]MDR3620507.1 hypothetical protein [Paludisphaera borealis]